MGFIQGSCGLKQSFSFEYALKSFLRKVKLFLEGKM